MLTARIRIAGHENPPGYRQNETAASVCATSLLPFVDRLLILLVGFDEPLADTNEGPVHEAALQQVMDGFEEQRSALVGQAAIPRTVLITCETQRTGQYSIISTCSAGPS